MWTNQPIFFGLIVLAVLSGIVLGWYVALIIIAIVLVFASGSRIKGLCFYSGYPNKWTGSGFSVRIVGSRDKWVEYEEPGRKLSLRAEWATPKGKSGLVILVEPEEYFAPDFEHPLSEKQFLEIQARISEGLGHLHIPHEFARLGNMNLG